MPLADSAQQAALEQNKCGCKNRIRRRAPLRLNVFSLITVYVRCGAAVAFRPILLRCAALATAVERCRSLRSDQPLLLLSTLLAALLIRSSARSRPAAPRAPATYLQHIVPTFLQYAVCSGTRTTTR
eukprot:6206897-Pleurochrysis_carterae.AAC.4